MHQHTQHASSSDVSWLPGGPYPQALLAVRLSCLLFAVKYLNPYTGVAIVRCAKEDQESVITCMACLTAVKARGITLRLVQMAGAQPSATRGCQAVICIFICDRTADKSKDVCSRVLLHEHQQRQQRKRKHLGKSGGFLPARR